MLLGVGVSLGVAVKNYCHRTKKVNNIQVLLALQKQKAL